VPAGAGQRHGGRNDGWAKRKQFSYRKYTYLLKKARKKSIPKNKKSGKEPGKGLKPGKRPRAADFAALLNSKNQ
jgi:hypothetical protein